MDLAEIIIRFANEISVSGWRLVFSLSRLIGTLYAVSTLAKFARESSIPGIQGQISGSGLVIRLIICAMFVQMPTMISATSHSFLINEVDYGPISYSSSSDFGRFAGVVNAALTIASLVGGICFLRGLLSLKRASIDGNGYQSDDTVMKAFVQMCFGAFLVQIDSIMDVVRTSLNLYW